MYRVGGIGASLVLIALGAILAWAVTNEAEGFNINTIGIILLVVGIVGLLLSLIMTIAVAGKTRSGDRDVTIIER